MTSYYKHPSFLFKYCKHLFSHKNFQTQTNKQTNLMINNKTQKCPKMEKRYVYGSLARISDLETNPFDVHPLKRESWETGDYVVGRYTTYGIANPSDEVELTTGRLAHVMKGDILVGALGIRKSTLESVGDWHRIGSDGRMEDLTGAGLFGRETSRSAAIPPSPPFAYVGHVIRNGRKVCMDDFLPKEVNNKEYNCPTILLIGTSMSSGKTTTARVIIHLLKEMGFKRVVGTKLAGAGYYHDILTFHDAGADAVFDFTDAGLPSSVVPPEKYQKSLRHLLSKISSENPDVVVAEAGASPFEPYNGSIAIEEMSKGVKFVILCASDSYAVDGIIHHFGTRPDIVTGIVTATSSGIDMVQKMTGISALNFTDGDSVEELRIRISAALKTQKTS